MTKFLLLMGSLAGVLGCGSSGSPADPLQLATFTDQNADPLITEVNLVATPSTMEYLDGKPGDVWAFRDGSAGNPATVPGPLLDVRQGEHVIVHFRNDLPEPTTIHWHGLRVPNGADGTPATQVVVAPGGSFDYEFDVLDAGLFWYHPHVAGDVQIERGLYGPIVVRGGVLPDVEVDRVLVLDDVKLEATGLLSTETDPLDIMLGRQGNVLLVNGHSARAVEATAGSRERWRFVNTANGRYFNLRVPGRELLVIGWDGGLLVDPYRASTVLIAPGERYDVLVELGGDAGDELELETIHYDRGHSIPDPGPRTLLTLRLGEPGVAPASLPASWGEVVPLAVDDVATPVRELVLTEEEDAVDPRFFINGEAFPDITTAVGTEGATEVWAIANETEMDHPFHLHGMSFQVLDSGGVPAEHLGWKDTVNVPQQTSVRFAVRLDAPGTWMYHCHILEHAERGMMGELEVSLAP